MKKCLFLLMILIAAIMVGRSFAQGRVLVTAANPYPPFLDPSSPKEGLAIELLRAAFKTQGYDLKWEKVPWARAMLGVKNWTYDFLPTAWMTEERKASFAFSEPYGENVVVFIKKKGDDFEYTSLDSLKGKKVGVVNGYGYGDEFLTSTLFTREMSTNLLINIKKLLIGRIDLTLEDAIVARSTIMKADPSLIDQIEFTKGALSAIPFHIAVGLSNPHCQEVISAFNKGLVEIKANGTYEKIMASYGIE